MTTRSLFNIIIKVIGILFVKDILTLVSSIFSVFLYYSQAQSIEDGVWVVILNLILLVLYGLIFYYLIFKTDTIIDKLNLDEGTHLETVSINIHRSTVLSIVVMVTGGLILAQEVPNLCMELLQYFQDSLTSSTSRNDSAFTYIVFRGVKIAIGLLLLGNQRQIVNYIELKRRG